MKAELGLYTKALIILDIMAKAELVYDSNNLFCFVFVLTTLLTMQKKIIIYIYIINDFINLCYSCVTVAQVYR